MPRILVIVFWCWFAFSVAVLLRRAYRKTTSRSTEAVKADTSRPTWPPLHEIEPQPAPSPTVDVPVGDELAERAPIAEAAVPVEVTESLGQAAAPGSDAAPPRYAASQTATQVQTRTRPASLGDVLRGIRMPCDLTPLTGTSADFERRAAFFSVRYPAEVVAPAVADELERIGMTFTTTSDNTAVAERDDARVLVAVRSVGAAVDGTTDLVYPTAPEHCVIVELELE